MLESLAAWLLRTYVGEYVENLNTDQLSIGYGGIELENLTLKKSALSGLELPVVVKSGFIGRLKLEIPYRRPKSQPWIIYIDKLYIVAGPQKRDYAYKNEEEKKLQQRKQQQLDALEAEWRARQQAQPGGWWSESWWPSLYSSFSTSVVENLQLKIENVHFRYEDDVTVAEKTFAVGITIDKLSAQSTDEAWTETFLQTSSLIKYKLVELQAFSVYLDSGVSLIGDLPSSRLEVALKDITFQDGKCLPAHCFVMEPVTGQARVRRNTSGVPLSSKDTPRFIIDVLLDKIPLAMSEEQYCLMVMLIEEFRRYFKAASYKKSRPQQAVKENAAAWWQFAIRSHLESIHDRNRRCSKDFIMERVTDILIYYRIYTDHLTKPESEHPESQRVQKEIEAKMSFEEIRLIRSMITAKILREESLKKAAEAALKSSASKDNVPAAQSSWTGWALSWVGYGSSGAPSVDDGKSGTGQSSSGPPIQLEPISQEEEEFLDELNDGHLENDSLFKRDYAFAQLHFRLNSGSFTLMRQSSTEDLKPLVETEFSRVEWISEVRPKAGAWEFTLSLGGMFVRDLMEENMLFPVLVQPQALGYEHVSQVIFTKQGMVERLYSWQEEGEDQLREEATPLLQIKFAQKSALHVSTHKLHVSLRPLMVIYNPLVIQKLQSFFSHADKSKYKLRISHLEGQFRQMALHHYEELKNATRAEFVSALDDIMAGQSKFEFSNWHVDLDIAAPQIILPEHLRRSSCSLVILNLGKILFMNMHTEHDKEKEKRLSFAGEQEDDDDDEFITPASTPDEEDFKEMLTSTSASSRESRTIEQVKEKFYERYQLSLSELQVLICKSSDDWLGLQRKGFGQNHVLDKFSLTIQLERRLVFTSNPSWPALTLHGNLPQLKANIDENKLKVIFNCIDALENTENRTRLPVASRSDVSLAELQDNRKPDRDITSQPVPGRELAYLEKRAKDLLIESKLILAEFKCEKVALGLHSRGRLVAELQLGGVKAEFIKRPYDYSASFMLCSLLLHDAIQPFGPEYQYLVASHVDLKPDKDADAKLDGILDSEALILLCYQQVSKQCPTLEQNADQPIRIASMNFNSLNIIANQETIVELINVVKQSIPKRRAERPVRNSRRTDEHTTDEKMPSVGQAAPTDKSQVCASVQSVNVILVRTVHNPENLKMPQRVGSISITDLVVNGTLSDEQFIQGSLGGVQVSNLLPGVLVHKYILSVGKRSCSRWLSHAGSDDSGKAFSFEVSKPTSNVVDIAGTTGVKTVSVQMATAHYIHCAKFLSEVEHVITDFKQYTAVLAKSLQDAATDMAKSLIRKREVHGRRKTASMQSLDNEDHMNDSIFLPMSPQKPVVHRARTCFKVLVETPVVIFPKCLNSEELLVGNLGQISVRNMHLPGVFSPVADSRPDPFIDRVLVDIKDISLCAMSIPPADIERMFAGHMTTIEAVSMCAMSLKPLGTEPLSEKPSSDHSLNRTPSTILHNTSVSLTVDSCTGGVASEVLDISNVVQPSLEIRGRISSSLKLVLSTRSYQQILATLTSLNGSQPPSRCGVAVPEASAAALLSPLLSPISSADISMDDVSAPASEFELSRYNSYPSTSGLVVPVASPPDDAEANNATSAAISARFEILHVEVKLIGELSGEERGFINVSLDDFDLSFDNMSPPLSQICVNLGGLCVQDLLYDKDDGCQFILMSSSREKSHGYTESEPRLCSSCPEEPDIVSYRQLSTSLPSVLHTSPKRSRHETTTSSLRSMIQMAQLAEREPSGCAIADDTAGFIDINERFREESLVRLKITTRDAKSDLNLCDEDQVSKFIEVDFSTLDVVVNLQTWVVVLEFFGIGTPQPLAMPNLDEAMSEAEAPSFAVSESVPVVASEAPVHLSKSDMTDIKIVVQAVSVSLNKEEYSLAKANLAALNCHMQLAGPDQKIVGSIGKASLVDMSPTGSLYKERFLTLGDKAVDFTFERFGEPDPDLRRGFDMRLHLRMSSIQYTHTQRFLSEMIAFFQHFLQLQEVLGRMRAASEGEEVYAIVNRGARLLLDIEADTPIIILPRSYASPDLLVGYLGNMKISNKFQYASNPNTVCAKFTASRSRVGVISPSSEKSTDMKLPRQQVSLCESTLSEDKLLDCIAVKLSNMEVFTAIRTPDHSLVGCSYGHARQGGKLMKNPCIFDIVVERNLESMFGRQVPDLTIAGSLSSLHLCLDLAQFGMVMGMLGENFGEPLEEFQKPSTYLVDPLELPKATSEVWTSMNINLDLVNVTIEMIPKFSFGEIPSKANAPNALAKVDFIQSKFLYESFSDGSKSIDLVSNNVLVHDVRDHCELTDLRGCQPNVFTEILAPYKTQASHDQMDCLQFEVHYLDTRDKTLLTFLCNRCRIVLVFDFLLAALRFITRKEESEYRESMSRSANLPTSPEEDLDGSLNASFSSDSSIPHGVVTKGASSPLKRPAPGKSFELKSNVTESQLVVVEDLTSPDARAVILRTTAVLAYRPGHPSERPVTCSLQSLEVFSCTFGRSEETALSIIDPVTLLVELNASQKPQKRPSVGLLDVAAIMPTLEVQLQSPLNIRLSYHDVKLFLLISANARRQLSVAMHSGKEETFLSSEQDFKLRSLQELGFSREQCIRALELNSGQTDEAASWLAANTKPTEKIQVTNASPAQIAGFEVRANFISICVIDDCGNNDIPLMEFSLNNVFLQHSLLFNDGGSSRGTVSSNYYNRLVSGWEPFIEPWMCNVHWHREQQSTSQDVEKGFIKVDGPERLEVNITSAFVDMIRCTSSLWTEDYYKDFDVSADSSALGKVSKKRAPFVPYVLRNKTGCILWFGTLTTSPSHAFPLSQHSLMPHDGSAAASVREISTNNWFELAPNSETPFSFETRTKLRHKSTHQMHVHQIVAQVEGWTQMVPVSVDHVGEYFRYAEPKPNAKGLYAALKSRPIRVCFEVTLEGARKVVTVRSSLSITNKLFVPVDLMAEHVSEKMSMPLFTLLPQCTYSVPIHIVQWSLYLKPHSSAGADFDYCREALDWRGVDVAYDERGFVGTCASRRGSGVFRFTYTVYCEGYAVDMMKEASREAVERKKMLVHPGHRISLVHHLTLTNLLPFDLYFSRRNVAQKEIVKPGKTVPLHALDASEMFELGFSFESFPKFDMVRVEPTFHSEPIVLLVRVYDINNRELLLNLMVNQTLNFTKLSLYAPYWLVNKTGLPLLFRRDGEGPEAAGQFEEHEAARSLSPLLFSYLDQDAAFRCQMRLGKGYQPDSNLDSSPLWCQSFSLEQEIGHRTLYLRQSSVEPARTFDVGISVSYGKGVFRLTKMVSFVTKFQLENRTQHVLAYAQRHAVRGLGTDMPGDTLTGLPGSLTMFHWPRSDLDQLLCMRLGDEPSCRWSGGFRIDQESSFHLSMRAAASKLCIFVRIEIVLKGATYQVIVMDTQHLPPPFKIDNRSDVEVTFWQDKSVDTTLRTALKPRQSMMYALDEPVLPPVLVVSVYEESSDAYNLLKISRDLPRLYYQNAIYIAFTHTFARSSCKKHAGEESEMYGGSQLVLDVLDGKHVVLSRKVEHKRSQLWRMTGSGMLKHVGSSPPVDPKRHQSLSEKGGLVLDIEHLAAVASPLQAYLILQPPNLQRSPTQTWFFESGYLRCSLPGLVVQPQGGVFGLKDGIPAILGPAIPPGIVQVRMDHCIERQKLRPGSGVLALKVFAEGPIQVLQINDAQSEADVESWAMVERTQTQLIRTTEIRKSKLAGSEIEVAVKLAGGIGVSLINDVPEEVLYFTFAQIEFDYLANEWGQTLELQVGNLQVDCQLFGSYIPVVLFPTPIKSSSERKSEPALQLSVHRGKSKSYNVDVFRRFVINMRKFTLQVEDRTLLKFLQILGVGREPAPESGDASEELSIYESHRAVESGEGQVFGRRVYFERLAISEGELKVSLLNTGKLTSDLKAIKKSLGVPLVSFEDAVIALDPYQAHHVFETRATILQHIGSYYKEVLKGQAAVLLGSLDILGNPMGLLHDVTSGVEGLVRKGNLGGLFVNMAHGFSDTAAKMTGSIADGLWSATMDTKFQESREAMRVERGNSSASHFSAGLKGLGMGVVGGLTSMVTQPIEGAAKRGVSGFIAGIGKGLIGTVAKPVAGVLDLASGTAAAVRTSAKQRDPVPNPVRPKRNCYGLGGVLGKYSRTAAEGQEVLLKFNENNIEEKYVAMEQIRLSEDKLKAILTNEGIYFVKSGPASPENIFLHVEYSRLYDTSYYYEGRNHYIEIYVAPRHAYDVGTRERQPEHRAAVRCDNEKIAHKVSQKINYLKSLYDERQLTVIKEFRA